jgi:hypothetical protein
MNDYQREQLAAFTIIQDGLSRMDAMQRRLLSEATAEYMQFRQSVDQFLNRYFNAICTQTCYHSRTSACCSKDGIITFFADAVINVLNASPPRLNRLTEVLSRVNTGHRCVYLGEEGCLWTVRPVVCAMFLCDRATAAVFAAAPEARPAWERLREQEKRFKWPDRPVLFDHLERAFLDLGYRSTLMHLNLSPGLLRVKRDAGLI